MNFLPIIIVIWITMVVLSLYNYSKPQKYIIKKYGYPIYHFSSQKCWNTLPIRGTRIDMDFFEDFVIISENNKVLMVINREFKDYHFYGSYLTLVFEIKINEKNVQILLTRKQKRLLIEFLD